MSSTSLVFSLLLGVPAVTAKKTEHLFCAADWASDTSIESLGLNIIAGGQGPNCTQALSGSLDASSGSSGIFLSTVNVYHVHSHSWQLLHLPAPRPYLTAASAGTKAYFAGGEEIPQTHQLGKKPNTDSVDIYDFSTQVWSVEKLSVPRKKLAACTMSDRWVAFAGGIDDSAAFRTRVDILDTATGMWTLHEMASPRMYFPAVCVDGVAVFAAGQQTALTSGMMSNNGGWDVFDSATGEWTNGSLPSGFARDKVAGTWARNAKGEGLALIVGMGAVDIYNAVTKQWSNTTEVMYRGGNLAAATIGDGRFALFMGGTGGPNGMSDAVEVYDAHDDTWFLAEPMSEGRGYVNGAGTSGAAMVGGGKTSNGTVSDIVDIYTVEDILGAKTRFFAVLL